MARIFVPGKAEPQGSSKGFIVGKHVNITNDNAKTKPWRAVVATFVDAEIGGHIAIPEGPVSIGLEFLMPRRAAEPKRLTPAHVRKPDIDKLARAILDALTGIVYRDDSQVDELTATKATAPIGEQPGVWIDFRRHDRDEFLPDRPVAVSS